MIHLRIFANVTKHCVETSKIDPYFAKNVFFFQSIIRLGIICRVRSTRVIMKFSIFYLIYRQYTKNMHWVANT